MKTHRLVNCTCPKEKDGRYKVAVCGFYCTEVHSPKNFCTCPADARADGCYESGYEVFQLNNPKIKNFDKHFTNDSAKDISDCVAGTPNLRMDILLCYRSLLYPERKGYKFGCSRIVHSGGDGPVRHAFMRLPVAALKLKTKKKNVVSTSYTPSSYTSGNILRDTLNNAPSGTRDNASKNESDPITTNPLSLSRETSTSIPSLHTFRPESLNNGSTLSILAPVTNQSSMARLSTPPTSDHTILGLFCLVILIAFAVGLFIMLKRTFTRTLSFRAGSNISN